MQRSPLFSRETARVLVGGRLSRILNWLSISQQELARQLSSHTPEATTTISATHLSNMIAGRRDLSGHLPDIVRVLAARVIPGERPAAAQEFRDWYGLLGVPLSKSEQFEGWFPGWPIPKPELAADIPPDHAHVPRPTLLGRVANALLKQSLEDDWAGLFHRRRVVTLTGMPGIGKRTLARQFISKAHPFFAGGVLYGDFAISDGTGSFAALGKADGACAKSKRKRSESLTPAQRGDERAGRAVAVPGRECG